MEFGLTAITVATMLAYAVPGYILVKARAVKEEHISAFSMVLLFVCQPCLSLYSFNKADYSPELVKNMAIFFALGTVLEVAVMGVLFLLFRKKYDDARYRVATIAAVFGNVGFFGVPLLEALLPQYPEAVAYSAAFIVSMNLLAWTLGAALLTRDKKYISIKKLILNPPVLILIVALPLFFTSTKLPAALDTWVTLLARMTTPLCMLILGMRLATADLHALFGEPTSYISVSLKLIVFPFLAYLAVYFLPVDLYIKQILFILCCCPTASVTQNLGEIYGVGQKPAGGAVLLSTLFSMLTIPLLLLIL